MSTDKVKLPEPFDYAYKFSSPFGGDVWRMSSNAWNGNRPQESTALYTEAQMLAMHEQGRLAGLEEAARAVADTPREEWVDGSDQWGNPCPARVYTTRAQYVAAIRSLAAASIGAKLGEE